MSKARTLADFVSTGGELADGQISVSEINDLTASAAELNTLDGITATVTELNTLDGATSSIQDQLDNISVTSGTLTKSFANGESASITLSSAISPAPVVSVTKEVAQTGVSSKGGWDVATDGFNYELHDTAYDTTLTPSNASADGTFTLGSGSFASTDVGKRIVGNGGEAILTATDGSYSLVTAFNDSSTIASGDWSMFALTFDGTDGVKVSTLITGENQTPSVHDVFGDSSIVATWTLEQNGNDLGGTYPLTANSSNFSTTSIFGSYSYHVVNDGSTDHYLIRDNDDIDILGDSTNSFSFSAWIRPSEDSLSKSFSAIVTLGDDANYDHFQLLLNNGELEIFQPSGATGTRQSLTANTWHHVALTFDSATSTAISYLDGVVQETATGVTGIASGSNCNILIGQEADAGNPFGSFSASQSLSGYIDQIRLFNRALTSSEITSLYGPPATPTSAYHPTVTKASGQIDTAFWTDINTMTADETLNNGEVYYAVSTDDRTTWAVIDDTDGVRPIVRDNAGTWQYNDATTYSGTTWVNATTNEELYALQEALEDGNAEEVVGFDLSNASYDSVSFDVSSQESFAKSVVFNSDGTKMYVVGALSDNVHQYSLSTAYDISTASYDSVSFSIGSQETESSGLAFNNDGTKMYIVGDNTNTAYQYSLSTAFDLSTASYDSVSFSFNTEDQEPFELTFNSDGTKMYMVGNTNNSVFQYSLSTAYDLSTASYDSVSFSVSSQETDPAGIAFSNDGTKMFVVGFNTDAVYQYSLSTAYDLSTASYGSVSFSVASQDGVPEGISFNNDGTKMYIMGRGNGSVFQYSTSSTTQLNRMNSTQLDAVTDPNHYTLGDTLDLAIMLYTADVGSIPESDGVTINYDAEALNQGAVLGTDYDFDFPDSTTVRVTSNAAQNLKIRVV